MCLCTISPPYGPHSLSEGVHAILHFLIYSILFHDLAVCDLQSPQSIFMIIILIQSTISSMCSTYIPLSFILPYLPHLIPQSHCYICYSLACVLYPTSVPRLSAFSFSSYFCFCTLMLVIPLYQYKRL
jgi:hypothetical protein